MSTQAVSPADILHYSQAALTRLGPILTDLARLNADSARLNAIKDQLAILLETRERIARIKEELAARQTPPKQLAKEAAMRLRNTHKAPPEPEPVPAVVTKAERVYSVLEIHQMWPGRSPDTLRRMFRNVEGVEVYRGAEATKEDGTQTRKYTALGIPESVYLRYRKEHAN
jgi:hypothetical protein